MSCTPRALLLLAAPLLLLAAANNLPAAQGAYNWWNATRNVDTYANVSLDIADMQALAAAGSYAEANSIYVNGKNAFRNIATGTMRTAYSFATAAFRHGGEPYYESFKAYYNTETFLDSWLGGAFNVTKPEYQNNDFRAASVAAYASVYGWLYTIHEVDAGLLALSGYTSPLRNVTRSVRGALSENDHGYAMWRGTGSVTPAIIARTAAKHACLSTKAIDAQMAGVDEGLNDSLAAALAAENDTTNANNQTYTNAFRAGRDKMVHYMMRSMVQTTLTSLRAATSTRNAAKRAGHQATALAAFRAVAPFINSQPMGDRAVKICFDAVSSLQSFSFYKAKAALTVYYAAQRIPIHTIYACK